MRTPCPGAVLTLAFALVAACGGSPSEASSAAVSGVVRDGDAGTALEGVSVSVGNRSATSDAQGRYRLDDVPTSNQATLRATRSGFDPYEATIAVGAAGTAHDVALTPQTVFDVGTAAVYIPRGVAHVRGVLLGLAAFSMKGLASGEVGDVSNPRGRESIEKFRQVFLPLASAHGLAILGTEPVNGGVAGDDVILDGLASAAAASGHPELADAPLLIHGSSFGAHGTHGFALRHPDRTIAIVLRIPVQVCCGLVPADVPGYVLLAALDTVVSNVVARELFDTHRASGSPWSFAVETGAQHDVPTSIALDLLGQWTDRMLAQRLPAGMVTPVQLVPLVAEAGWLGDIATGTIAAWPAYLGDLLQASWFPSQETAEGWRAFTSETP